MVVSSDSSNEINYNAMFWNVCHMWLVGAHFRFNTYRHWKFFADVGCHHDTYQVGGCTGLPFFCDPRLHLVIPIIKTLHNHMQKMESQWSKDTLQVWYANDSALASTFTRINSWFS